MRRLVAGGVLLLALAACGDDRQAPTAMSASVRVESEGCSLHHEVGGGAFVAAATVVTVAHVVAGATDVDVVLADGTEKTASVVALDRRKDLALLRVDADVTPLPLGAMRAGSHGTFVTWRSGTAHELAFSATQVVDIQSSDIDHASTDLRRGYAIEASIQAGDSGSVLVSNGRAVAVVFARSSYSNATGWATSAEEVRALLNAPHDHEVNTGECPSRP